MRTILKIRRISLNNIYIFKIEDFTEQDALLVKKFDKSDKVIFMPNETGMISYALFPILATWKTEPIFMQPIADCSDTEPMLFLLGLQCADCNGDLYIVMRDNPFKSLEACEFGTSKGHVCIHVAESLADVLPKKKTRQGKRLELAAENEPQTANTEEEIYTDALQTAVPDKFANAIASIEATTGANLVNNMNEIYNCVKDSKDDLLPTFEFQLGMKFPADTVEILLRALEPSIDMLKELV
jgi:hypothetical protein